MQIYIFFFPISHLTFVLLLLCPKTSLLFVLVTSSSSCKARVREAAVTNQEPIFAVVGQSEAAPARVTNQEPAFTLVGQSEAATPLWFFPSAVTAAAAAAAAAATHRRRRSVIHVVEISFPFTSRAHSGKRDSKRFPCRRDGRSSSSSCSCSCSNKSQPPPFSHLRGGDDLDDAATAHVS